MKQEKEPEGDASYPIGRGYGHDYMRGGEVLGGYGYSQRPEYTRRLGEDEEQTENDEQTARQTEGRLTRPRPVS